MGIVRIFGLVVLTVAMTVATQYIHNVLFSWLTNLVTVITIFIVFRRLAGINK